MAEDKTKRNSADFGQGISLDQLPDGGRLVGHFNSEDVLLVRSGEEIFAVSPHCTHYNGPLAEGLVVGDTVRCPWHHACFDLRTGEALRAPALSPIACWEIELRDGTIRVSHKRQVSKPKPRGTAVAELEKIVIIGGGAAGFAAVEMLRRKGYQRGIVMLSSDDALPYDRPKPVQRLPCRCHSL
jgi:nitrite reductase/ring-hydroxylating ferredoxin subunit